MYYISGNKDDWTATRAKTVRGAKALCSKAYQATFDGVMHVGKKMGAGDSERIERIAVKEGYNAWRAY